MENPEEKQPGGLSVIVKMPSDQYLAVDASIAPAVLWELHTTKVLKLWSISTMSRNIGLWFVGELYGRVKREPGIYFLSKKAVPDSVRKLAKELRMSKSQVDRANHLRNAYAHDDMARLSSLPTEALLMAIPLPDPDRIKLLNGLQIQLEERKISTETLLARVRDAAAEAQALPKQDKTGKKKQKEKKQAPASPPMGKLRKRAARLNELLGDLCIRIDKKEIVVSKQDEKQEIFDILDGVTDELDRLREVLS